MPKIKIYCNTGFSNRTHEDEYFIDDAVWAVMTEEEKEAELDNAANTLLQNKIDCGAYVED